MPRGIYPRKPKTTPQANKDPTGGGLTRPQQAVIHLQRAWALTLADVRRGADLREQDLETKHALTLLTTREK